MKPEMRTAVLSVALTSLFSLVALPQSSAWAEDTSDSKFDAPTSPMDRPVTGYVWVDSDEAEIIEHGSRNALGHTNNIIFLNRCVGGCTISPGGNDSRTNRSSIVGSTVNLSEWGKGDAQWKQLVDCVTALYDPYDIVITDVDPGPNVEHFEAIVAGRSSEIGGGSNIGGIAPFSCGVINNAITFNFANASFYADGIDGICETVGQETAHAFGLEHEFLCTDPMTYLPSCGQKWFQDQNASCGEYEPKACQCRSNQNSHRLLEGHFGAGVNPGPKMEFVRPAANTNVEPGFVIEVSGGSYYYGAKSVEVLVNGTSLGPVGSPPYIFNAPAGLEGLTTLEVKAVDARGYASSTFSEINVGASCSGGDCPSGRVCYKDFCIADATTEGGFGSACDTDSACDSNICAKNSDGEGSCTDICELKNGDCPTGFGCLEAGSTNVCWAGVSEDPDGCGCNASNPGTGVAGMLLVFLGLFFQRRRRVN